MAGSGSFIHVQSSLFAIINNLSYLHLHLHLAFYSPTSCCINLWSSNLPKLPNLDVLHMQNSPTSAFLLGFQPFPALVQGKIAISQKLAERHRVALEGWIQTQCPAGAPCGPRVSASAETLEEAPPLALEDLPRAPKAKVKAKAARAPRQQPSKGIIARAGRVRLYQAGAIVSGEK